MKRKQQITQLDLYLAQHKGLLSNAEEQRYIDLLISEAAKPAPEAEEGAEPQEEPLTLELIKLYRKLQLKVYDNSTDVNSFVIGGQSMWIGKYDRANYRNAINAAKEKGRESVKFAGFVIPTVIADAALTEIEDYAAKCAEKTDDHAAAIAALQTAEAVEAYDFTIGYPSHPEFNL